MVHNTDGSNNLSDNFGLAQTFSIRGITNDQGGFGLLATALDANNFAARLKQNFFNICVEHVSTSMNGAETTEGLW